MPRVLPNQTAFDLFTDKPKKRPQPTWDDVQKGRAELVDRIEPCEGEECQFWRGECTHTAENFGYPKKRPNGMCLVHYIEWKDIEGA